jgi:hypothetical protein
MDSEFKDWLLEIVAEDEWDEDELAEWANDFLIDHYQGDYDHTGCDERAKIDVLKPLVTQYKHDHSLPKLPAKPDGSLHGIGFVYDEDSDDRVLVAIDQLKDDHDVVALAEHEGVVEIYSRLPTGLTGLSVCDDEWCVNEYVPYRGRWIEVDQQFIKNCVAQVLGYPSAIYT